VSVCSYDRESTPEGDAWVVAFADEGFDWGTIDTALTVTSAIERIEDPTDRAIAEGYRDGMGSVEIGGELGIHYSTVIKRRQRNLAPFFSEFV